MGNTYLNPRVNFKRQRAPHPVRGGDAREVARRGASRGGDGEAR